MRFDFSIKLFFYLSFIIIFFTLFNSVSFSSIRFVSNFEAKDCEGNNFSLEKAQSSHQLIFFFSLFSENLDSEMNSLKTLRKKYKIKGVDIVGINVDPEAEESCKKIDDKKFGIKVIPDPKLVIVDKFGVKKTPAIFLLDSYMNILYSSEGEISWDELEEQLQNISVENNKIADKNKGKLFKIDVKNKLLICPSSIFYKLSPDGRKLFYITKDRILWLFDILRNERKEVSIDVNSADWSPDSNLLCYGTMTKKGIWVYNLKTEEKVKIAPSGDNVKWSPKNNFIAYIVADREVWIFNRETTKRWRVGVNGNKVEWDKTGEMLLIGDKNGKLWFVSPYHKHKIHIY